MPRVTSKGQVTIPKEVRDALGLERGSEVEFVLVDNGRCLLRRSGQGPSLDRWVGRLKRLGRTDELIEALRGQPEP